MRHLKEDGAGSIRSHVAACAPRTRGIGVLMLCLVSALCLFMAVPPAYALVANTVGDYGNVTVIEVSGDYNAYKADRTLNSEARQALAKEFFRTHEDDYDFLMVFTNFGFGMPADHANAFYTHIKNDTLGIGKDLFDYSADFGSGGRLQGMIDMGDVADISMVPTESDFSDTLGLLSHELMHRWSGQVSFVDSDGTVSGALLGLNSDHWSYLLDTEGSVLYGNDWVDNGNGTFTSRSVTDAYSPLDLYLMGVIGQDAVPAMLLIENPSIDPAKTPIEGLTITGTAKYVTIDDIIATEGQRSPSAEDAPRTFKTAFIYAVQGEFTADEVAGLEDVRNESVVRFSILTDGAGLMQVASTPIEEIPANPGAIVPSSEPRTLPPDIQEGVAWLASKQAGEGIWMDLDSTVIRDTSEAVAALSAVGDSTWDTGSAVQWLSSAEPKNLDFLSRKVRALAVRDSAAGGEELLSGQNADGGWGSAAGYVSNPYDTALALLALAGSGAVDYLTVQSAVDYLKGAVNTDGSWGVGDGRGQVQVTAAVISAFNAYRVELGLDDHIDGASQWLALKQNSDGGYGNSPSTIYDTALALMALVETGAEGGAVNEGVDYLLGQQSADGSWQESSFQTALAVNALWAATVTPDLKISSEYLSFIPTTLSSIPANVTLSAVISNAGRTDVAQATVTLYARQPSLGNVLDEQTLAFPGLSSTTVTFPVSVTDNAVVDYYVMVDSRGEIAESSEANNTARKSMGLEETYDFEIGSGGVELSAQSVELYSDMQISATVLNKGAFDAYNVKVEYYIEKDGESTLIGSNTVDIEAGGETVTGITWNADISGDELTVSVVADPAGAFQELSEDNNTAAAILTVTVPTGPNLTAYYQEIALTPNPADESGSVEIVAVVRNVGDQTAENIGVEIYRGVPESGGVLINSLSLGALGAGDSATVGAVWADIDKNGEEIIYIKIDPANLVEETNEADNYAFDTLTITALPDLAVYDTMITFSPSQPKEGDIMTISAVLKNEGEQSASQFSADAYVDGVFASSAQVQSIDGGDRATVSFTYDTTGVGSGAHSVEIRVDAEGAVNERTKDNNAASKSFGIQDSDLWLSEQYISPNGDDIQDSTQFAFMLDISQSVSVKIVSESGETVKTFSGGSLSDTNYGVVTWDGLNGEGKLVEDGKYRIKVTNSSGVTIGSLTVVVDTNSLPLEEAIGKGGLIRKNLTCDSAKPVRSEHSVVSG